MKAMWIVGVSMMVAAIAAPLSAGAPLKGVDVKLGRNPGGSAAAARTTGDDGRFDFGIVAKGSYTIVLAEHPVTGKPAASARTKAARVCELQLDGANGGPVRATYDFASGKVTSASTARTKNAPPNAIVVSVDGHHALRGRVTRVP